MLTYYELDLGLNHVVRKWSEATDPRANLLVQGKQDDLLRQDTAEPRFVQFRVVSLRPRTSSMGRLECSSVPRTTSSTSTKAPRNTVFPFPSVLHLLLILIEA